LRLLICSRHADRPNPAVFSATVALLLKDLKIIKFSTFLLSLIIECCEKIARMDIFTLLLVLAGFASAQINDSQNHFILPPPFGIAQDYSANLIWPYDSSQQVQWQTNWSAWSLWIRQDNRVGLGDPVSLGKGPIYYLIHYLLIYSPLS
jgi:hypothetical protein